MIWLPISICAAWLTINDPQSAQAQQKATAERTATVAAGTLAQPITEIAALKTRIWVVQFDPSIDPAALPINTQDAGMWIRGRSEPVPHDAANRVPTNGLARQIAAAKFKVESGGCTLKIENGNLVSTPEKGNPPWTTIAAPQIVAALGQEAQITVGRPIAYLERGAGDCLVVKQSPDSFEGLSLKLKAERIDAKESRFSNIEVRFSQITGRQPLDGVPLDVGRPIIDTRETSLGLTIAPDMVAVIPLPQAPGEPALLIFLTAAKVE